MNKAIFLDRDGTIIKDKGYISKVNDVIFYPFTFKSLRELQKEFLLFIVTNQAGIGKGLIQPDEMHAIHQHILMKLNEKQINIQEIFFCPHTKEENCLCRKPSSYFLNIAKVKYNLDLQNSYVIGDHPSDIELAINANTNGIYVLTGHGQKHFSELKDHSSNILITSNLKTAARHILRH